MWFISPGEYNYVHMCGLWHNYAIGDCSMFATYILQVDSS